ncbi:MAG: VWA domain-containing protein [Flavobacteriales bacterium]|nr:VWA domain-containing protein [Flavobacteriales bacterium]
MLFLFWNRHEYANPQLFAFSVLLPLLAAFYIFRRSKLNASVKLSSIDLLRNIDNSWIHVWRYSCHGLRFLALSAMIIAIARPQSSNSWKDVITEGIDIVLAMDISFSMLAKDFDPDRLEGSKDVALSFISERPNDRIGLVVYEGEAFTQVPLTTDHRVLREVFSTVKPGLLESGTAIGMGLATAVNRLKESEAKSKVIILLTDGVNNQGSISPITAAEIAAEFGIRVYTIGVGTQGSALSPVQYAPNGVDFIYKRVPVEIDEETLQEISKLTDGEYFRATDNKSLFEIYKEIDLMEKTRTQVTEHSRRTDLYFPYALVACIFLGLEFLIRTLILRTTP